MDETSQKIAEEFKLYVLAVFKDIHKCPPGALINHGKKVASLMEIVLKLDHRANSKQMLDPMLKKMQELLE